MAEAGPGAVTLPLQIDVLFPRQMPLDLFDDLPHALRQAGVGVVALQNKSQCVARRQDGLLAHFSDPTTLAATALTCRQLLSIRSRAL